MIKLLLFLFASALAFDPATALPKSEGAGATIGKPGALKAQLQSIRRPSMVSAETAYEIAMALYKCRFFPNNKREFKQAKAHYEAVYSRPHPQLGTRSYEDAIKEQIQQYHICRGLTTEDLIASTDWLSLAAKKGHTRAQLSYYGYGLIPQRAPITAAEYNKRLKEYKKNALDFLQEALKGGEQEALYYLGLAYSDGFIVEHDEARAAAFFQAFRNCGGVILQSEILETIDTLSESQRLESESLARSLDNQFCD